MGRKRIGKRKRCPSCMSVEIYKRNRKFDRKETENKKDYICRNCKKEFDVPIDL